MLSNFRRKQKSTNPHPLLLKVGVVLILCICIVLIFINIRMFQKRSRLKHQVADLEAKIHDLKTSNTNLQEGISKSDDANYIEKVAREELDLQKPGEKVISFVKAPVQEEPSLEQKSIWQAWLGWVGDWFKK